MDASPPVLRIQDRVAYITLNRPHHKNRLEHDDLVELTRIFSSIAMDRDVRVVVLTGNGDVFSAGFDLNAIAAGDVGDPVSGPGGFGLVADALECLPQATIARLNGGVYGGATDLALACDFRIGVLEMEAVMPAARLGLHYYKGGIKRYVSRLGLDNAKRMFLTAERIGAGALLEMGYLTQLVTADRLDEVVAHLAQTLAANAPLAVQGMKLSLNEFARQEWDDDVFFARAEIALKSDDLRKGVSVLLQKRKPDF